MDDMINNMENIYGMKLHETVETYFAKIIRVPGGWIYGIEFADSTGKTTIDNVYVPFNDEYMSK